jgi:predicted deacylase
MYGTSFGGRPLLAYRFGTGPSVHAIIGGIHGGYEWNTVVLVSETLTYLQENPALVPDGVTLYVIPCANPDGYAAGTDREHGRPNGNGVDLNRNWDYHWQPEATHGTWPVDAGASPFSEPETAALRDFILERNVEAAIFYHSAMARIFYGAERDQSATYELAMVVSEATGYSIAAGVPGQIITGDAVDWMSAQGLAGIEVELTTHEDIEWECNLQGLLAFLNWTPPPRPATVVQTSQIGISVQGRLLEVTQVGNGDRVALVIIGSIHGDEANTNVLVRGLMEQYVSAPESVPSYFTLYFLPAMNPDGLAVGTRPNANQVDLNRNWPTDDWQADAACISSIIPGSGGPGPGSEPEVRATSRWLLDTVKPAAQEVWLLSYRSAYLPNGGVQPGYTVYGAPGPQAEHLAQRVADLSGYAYLPIWPSEIPFTGELIRWCDLNGIWAADVELPNYDPPDTTPNGVSETTLVTHQHVLSDLLASFEPNDRSLPGEDGTIRYTVQPGDTLLEIAIRFDVEMEEIMRLNGIIGDENLIVEGEEILIPVATGDRP